MNNSDFKKIPLELKDTFLIEPFCRKDERGCFLKDFNVNNLNLPSLKEVFYSFSYKNVIRGMHYQKDQAKIVRCISGKIFDVIIDCRKDSPTYLKKHFQILSSEEGRAIYIPGGFAHGFLALEDSLVSYKCDETFNANKDDGINCFDKDLDISWPFNKENAIISKKDKELPPLHSFIKEIDTL